MNKEIHIVFRVLNFLFSSHHLAQISNPNQHRILILLAKHQGPKGICPSITTLAKEMNIAPRSTRRLIAHWEELEIIKIDERAGKPNQYYLYIPDPTPDTSVTPDSRVTPDTGVRVPLTAVSLTPDTSVTLYNKEELKNNKSFYMQKNEEHKISTRPQPKEWNGPAPTAKKAGALLENFMQNINRKKTHD